MSKYLIYIRGTIASAWIQRAKWVKQDNKNR